MARGVEDGVGAGAGCEDEAHGARPAALAVELDEGEVAPVREDDDPLDGDGGTTGGATGTGEARPESARVHGWSVYLPSREQRARTRRRGYSRGVSSGHG